MSAPDPTPTVREAGDATAVAHILRRVARHPNRKPSTRVALLRYADQIVTDDERETGDEGIAAVLAAHREDASYPNTCLCETDVPDRAEGHYVAHLAAILAPLIAEREAEAWAEGYGCGRDDECADQRGYEPTGHPNPYRAALAAETPEGDA